ncbi:hypothetical protein CAC42_2551 [Sphaceloma murrayae]|uniref:magnesium chelatase n=1 Tax=Sphaceloma murrayae TaxID=2082308 RepID=A0A2K1QWE4_9PEZI|nr:hypothetical protein CAC42_2551 [Sphaceloma murrayae]
MSSDVISRVQELGGLGLACVLCLTTEQHGIVLADQEELDDVARALAMSCSEELGLSTIVIECSDGTDLDFFRQSILVDCPNDTDSDVSHHEQRAPPRHRRRETPELSLDERRVADVIIAKNLNKADHYVQVQALELMRTGRMYTHTAMHSTGRDFLLMALNEYDSAVHMSKHLSDLFAIAHHHQGIGSDSDSLSIRSKLTSEASSLHSVVQGGPRPRPSSVKTVSLRPIALSDLREATVKVTMTAEVSAYLQNVIVAMRLHRYVAGGISAFATRCLRMAAKALAVLHGIDYVTPAIVDLAVRKVYLHRLVLADERSERSLRWGSDPIAVRELMSGITVESAIETVLASVQSPL